MTKEMKPQADAPQAEPQTHSDVRVKVDQDQPQQSASGRWGAVHRARLPHKAGLPLSSGGCGDSIER
jgi:hypothetical protein